MALQTFDFDRRPGVTKGYGDIFKNILEGYKGSRLPHELRQQEEEGRLGNERARLANSMQQAREPYAGQYAANEANKGLADIEHTRMMSGLGGLSGELGNVARLQKLVQERGADDLLVRALMKQHELNQKQQEGLIENRDLQTQTGHKRASTTQAKRQQELQEVMDGYMPGTNGQVRLNPEQQQALKSQYELMALKEATDTNTRNKVLLASNIDKTMDSFNVNDLTKYAGVAGGLSKKLEQGKALTGKESEEFAKYEEAKTAVDLLASQVRQFYGDSITESSRKHLEELTNPATWMNNPEIARRKFNSFKNILKRETDTYRNALKSPSEFKGEENDNDPLGLFK